MSDPIADIIYKALYNETSPRPMLAESTAKQIRQQILDICQPSKTCERLTVMALKHCPQDHHDWEEVKRLSYAIIPSTVPEDTA